MERGKGKGKVSLRRNLWKLANGGNPAANIFLAMNLLGYRDVVNNEHTGSAGGPIEIVEAQFDVARLTWDELQQLNILYGKMRPVEEVPERAKLAAPDVSVSPKRR
jgi:hypothetical protein